MTTSDILSITVPAQTTPQTAKAAKDALAQALSDLPQGASAQLSCEGGVPSVLAVQLCHAALVAADAKGAQLTPDDALGPLLTTSLPTAGAPT